MALASLSTVVGLPLGIPVRGERNAELAALTMNSKRFFEQKGGMIYQ
jgi:hypothetical protein